MRAWMLPAGVLTVSLIVFLLVEAAGIPLLTDPRSWLGSYSVVAAAIGVALLVVDVLVPLPASLVMVALGATFGWAGGMALSVVGSVGSFAVGYYIGRRSKNSLKTVLPGTDVTRARAMVERWGMLAIVVSRPIPLLAETVAISTGAFGMRTLPAFFAAVVGAAGPAAALSYAGWRGATTADGIIVFLLVVLASGICWFVGRRLTPAAAPQPQGDPAPAGQVQGDEGPSGH
ncbi:VTT domain-containing protein [Nonomuraea typhae]|uniref:VTT domain-containing protein n=1 Tax=Nonomuraea typhae TaxID=2603600 RepID=A0ABW7Z9I0_9ACTN